MANASQACLITCDDDHARHREMSATAVEMPTPAEREANRRSEPVSRDRAHNNKAGHRRAFERDFDLAEYVEVTAATLENGLLEITLKRELPETLKPRRIAIGADRVAGAAEHASQPSRLPAA